MSVFLKMLTYICEKNRIKSQTQNNHSPSRSMLWARFIGNRRKTLNQSPVLVIVARLTGHQS
jgi:hypothetical protein